MFWETVGAGLANIGGTIWAGEKNEDIARDATNANMADSKLNREFQERMSNTAHQRQVRDLKKAGLNPLLSATNGASSPGGSTGSAVTSQYENPLSGIVSSAMQAKQLALNAEKQGSEIDLLKAQAGKARMETRTLGADAEKSDILTSIYQKGRDLINEARKTNANMPTHKSQEIKDFEEKYRKMNEHNRKSKQNDAWLRMK